MTPPLTIVICTTPRSGSTLLCALLESSGVAGRPESWYRAEDRQEYADDWQVARDAADRIDPATYLSAAISAGQSANGVCGLRIQAVTLREMLVELRALFGPADTDRALLERAFGPCHFVYARRLDDVAQAVSRLKAEVSQVWHLDGTQPDRPKSRATYDAQRLDAFRAEAAQGNAEWQAWFAAEGIQPTRLVYETFATDPAAHVRALLAELSLQPTGQITAPNRRMADGESAEWSARYRAERGLPAGGADAL
ncbi:MAG: Stf0 sulfotransferase [Cereibacter sphaeroides]|uniref:Stf0 sulfotransferase n=1 Tax=Cereibacter sphaeroides TaxID=1063 RepID=A0A2W5S1Y6_CERSP|nr:MAG: Stf0 sulfotransferase [Cereibacter sphaeroides]